MTQATYLVSKGESATPPLFYLVGTRSGLPFRIDGRAGIASSMRVQGLSELLTPPAVGHPDGFAVITLAATTPPNGINPEKTNGYFSVFDAATGRHLFTSAPVSVSVLSATPIALVKDELRLASCEYINVSRSGAVGHVAFPGEQIENEGPACIASPVVAGKIIIYGSGNGTCPTAFVSDVNSETTVSRSPCLSDLDRGRDHGFFNGSAYGIEDVPNFISAATGSPLAAEGTFKPSQGFARFLAGPRSDIVLMYSTALPSPAYFVSTSNWQPVFTASSEQSFTPFGIADDDAWVEGAAGRVVIDARTGRTVAHGWGTFPEAGGAGWTLTVAPDVCCSHEYLVRGPGPLTAG